MRRNFGRSLFALGAAAVMTSASLVASAGVSGALSKSSASSGPIKVASLASISGAASFSGWQLGAQAEFDYVNSHGGINGRKITFKILTDDGSPTQDSELARKEVDTAGVVAFAGSISLDDCGVNAKYYEKAGIASIDVGSTNTCFSTPNMDPVNSGPSTDSELQMVYAAKVLHKTKVCFFSQAVPGEDPAFAAAVKAFEKVTGLTVTKWVENYPITASPNSAILELQSAGCQAVALPFETSGAVPLLSDAHADGITDIQWISGLSLYTPTFIKEAGAEANGMYLDLEFAPPGTSGTAQMTSAFKADKVAYSEPEESSYTAAWVLVHVLKTIKGSITKSTVLHAFKTMKPLKVPTMGTDFTFGSAKQHHPNEAGYFVKIATDKFVPTDGKKSWFKA